MEYAIVVVCFVVGVLFINIRNEAVTKIIGVITMATIGAVSIHLPSHWSLWVIIYMADGLLIGFIVGAVVFIYRLKKKGVLK